MGICPRYGRNGSLVVGRSIERVYRVVVCLRRQKIWNLVAVCHGGRGVQRRRRSQRSGITRGKVVALQLRRESFPIGNVECSES